MQRSARGSSTACSLKSLQRSSEAVRFSVFVFIGMLSEPVFGGECSSDGGGVGEALDSLESVRSFVVAVMRQRAIFAPSRAYK